MAFAISFGFFNEIEKEVNDAIRKKEKTSKDC
jgi:hypothetical protein